MSNNKKKNPKGVDAILKAMEEISGQIKKLQGEYDVYKSQLRVRDEQPVPDGFDYKEAILDVFKQKPNAELQIDDVVRSILSAKNFTPDRNIVSLRITYMVDSAKPPRLKRVEGKRGFYRLIQDTEEQQT